MSEILAMEEQIDPLDPSKLIIHACRTFAARRFCCPLPIRPLTHHSARTVRVLRRWRPAGGLPQTAHPRGDPASGPLPAWPASAPHGHSSSPQPPPPEPPTTRPSMSTQRPRLTDTKMHLQLSGLPYQEPHPLRANGRAQQPLSCNSLAIPGLACFDSEQSSPWGGAT